MSVHAVGFSVIVPRGHRLAQRQGAAINALHHEWVIVVADPDVSDRVTAAFGEGSVEPASVIRMPGLDSLKRAVEMGLGIGVVPSGVASALHPQRTLVTVPLASTAFLKSLTVIYRRNESLSGNAAQFVDIVRRSQDPAMSSGESTDARRTAARI